MPGVARIGAGVAATALLLAPAIWNRFPLLQFDTGGYLARWFEGTLEISRSTTYGLLITLLAHPDFWPAVILQSALTVWVLALTLRAFGFGGRPLVLLGVTAALAGLTTLPWLAGILITDIFAGLGVLALYLLAFADTALRRSERWGLVALAAFAASTHGATFGILAGLALVLILGCRILRTGTLAGAARGLVAVALGAALLLAANYAVAGRLAWTPGGASLSFGRMLQDGLVARYLDEHCPDPKLRLCEHRHELPDDADVFFWGNGIFDRLGGFEGLGDEMETIVSGSLRDHPLLQLEMAVRATLRQLGDVATGEGVVDTMWHTYGIIERFVPSAVPDMRAARQQNGQIGFHAINLVHVPVALGAMALLLVVLAAGLRHPAFADLGGLAATVTVALLGNAVVSGVFANPHDRYGARLAWIPVLVILLTALRLAHLRRKTAGGPIGA